MLQKPRCAGLVSVLVNPLKTLCSRCLCVQLQRPCHRLPVTLGCSGVHNSFIFLLEAHSVLVVAPVAGSCSDE